GGGPPEPYPSSSDQRPSVIRAGEVVRGRHVAVTVHDLPFAVLAPPDVRRAQRVLPGLAVHLGRGVLERYGVAHVADRLAGDQVHPVVGDAGEPVAQPAEHRLELGPAAPGRHLRAEKRHRVPPRPQCDPWFRVTAVDGQFRLGELLHRDRAELLGRVHGHPSPAGGPGAGPLSCCYPIAGARRDPACRHPPPATGQHPWAGAAGRRYRPVMDLDPATATAGQLARAISARELSSRELLDHLLDRAGKINPQLNAIVAWDTERARAAADAADQATTRGEIAGPLHGLPMTVKDLFETEGLVT